MKGYGGNSHLKSEWGGVVGLISVHRKFLKKFFQKHGNFYIEKTALVLLAAKFTVKNNDPVLPSVRESHARTKAWNEYVLEHLSLRLDEECRPGYRSMSVYQGSFCLYHNWTVNIGKTTDAEMHKYLRQFLEKYLEHFRQFKDMAANPNFQPPDL